MLNATTALVTGGTRGLGYAIAKAMADAGARVVITGRSDDAGRAAVQSMALPDGQVSHVTADMSTAHGARATVELALGRLGHLDIVVNNVGGTAGNAMGPFLAVDDDSWMQIFELNVHSMFHATKQALPHMLDRGSGRIINMSSVEGKEGKSGFVAYSTTKHAVVGFTKALAQELGTTGITVNALCPGLCATDAVFAAATTAESLGMSIEQLLSSFTARTAIKRLIEPSEVAALAVFLASEAAGALTGTALSIDGGQSPY